MARIAFAIILGNLVGCALFRLAAWASPQWWRSVGDAVPFGKMLWLISLTAIAFATPPVIVGALAARLAGRYEPAVGLASALWGLSARQWWPSQVPLLPPESWVAPMTLILLSGLVGGWLAARQRPQESAPLHSPASKHS
ncbi:MAG: hypothetical protein FJ030_11820 [Chloroflexi bacterium]|nr:hypothetical protein [Chloroflexota bacterium]